MCTCIYMFVYVYVYVSMHACVLRWYAYLWLSAILSLLGWFTQRNHFHSITGLFFRHIRPPRREMGILRSLLLFVVVMVTAISRKYAEAAESKFSVLIKSGAKLCAADPPFVTKENVTLVHCATRCASLKSCAHFNYKKNEKTCEIYLLKPECYLSTPTCAHYQVN